MEPATIYIKNMVCSRCIRVVNEDLQSSGFDTVSVELGKVVLKNTPTMQDRQQIEAVLRASGFEVINDMQYQIIERIKTIVIELIHHARVKPEGEKLSKYLERELGTNYSRLSKLFSAYVGVTIEKYLILQRIEKVKELLLYDELTLSEIAFDLGYSSTAHLSGQFKKVTGLTPTNFKRTIRNRKSIDKL